MLLSPLGPGKGSSTLNLSSLYHHVYGKGEKYYKHGAHCDDPLLKLAMLRLLSQTVWLKWR